MATVSSREFAEWIAYDRIASIDLRDYVQFAGAVVAQTVANCNRSRGQRPYKISEFYPQWSIDRKKQDTKQMHAVFASFAKAHNAIARG